MIYLSISDRIWVAIVPVPILTHPTPHTHTHFYPFIFHRSKIEKNPFRWDLKEGAEWKDYHRTLDAWRNSGNIYRMEQVHFIG